MSISSHTVRGRQGSILFVSLATGLFSSALCPAAGAQQAPQAGEEGTVAPASGGEAAVRFRRGLELFDEGDYKLALVEFERAYELAPNYRALYNIALVNIQLARYAEATRKLQAYLNDGGDGIPPTRRAEVQHTLSELGLRTATLSLSASARGAQIRVDGKPITTTLPGELLIDAGEHVLSAIAPGYQGVERSVTLAGADRLPVRFNLTPIIGESAPETPRQHVYWPGVVTAGVLATGAVVSFVLMLNAHSSLESLQNQVDSSASSRQMFANRVNTAALITDAVGGLAVLTGGVTIYLSLRTDRPSRSPSIAITPSSIALTGQF